MLPTTQSAPMPPTDEQLRDYYGTLCAILFNISFFQGCVTVNAALLLLDHSIQEKALELFKFWVGFTATTVIIFKWGIQSVYEHDASKASIYRILLAVVIVAVEPLTAWTFWGDQYVQSMNDRDIWHTGLIQSIFIMQGFVLLVLDMAYCYVLESDAMMINRDRPMGAQEIFAGHIYGAIGEQINRLEASQWR